MCNCTQTSEENQEQKTVESQKEVNQETQTTSQQQTNSQQQSENTQQQTTSQQAGDTVTSQNVNKILEEIKESFSELIPIFKKPTAGIKELVDKDNIVPGMTFIVVKAILTLIIVLIAFRDTFSYVSVGGVMFAALLLTIGADCLEAVLLKVISDAFKVNTTTKSMVTVVGVRAALETAVLIVVAILAIVSGSFAMVIYTAASAAIPAFQYGLYHVTTKGDADKKIYAYMAVMAIMAFVAALVTYIFSQSIISGLMGSMLGGVDGLMGNLFGGF